MFQRVNVRQGESGYLDKNENMYRYCNAFHDEGFRCTRKAHHKGNHAAHIVMGVAGTTDKDGNVLPGVKNTEIVMIAIWDGD